MRNILLRAIKIDGGTQPREEIDQATVDEYAESMSRLEEFPPLVVYHDGVNTWLADGFHRYHAAKKAGVQSVDVDWREGTLEMAKLYAAGANAQHGRQRTIADRRRAIEMVWSTEEGKRWTQEKIAKHCHVSQPYVSKILGAIITGYNPPRNPPVRQPSVREQKRIAVKAAVGQRPDASDRELARDLGVDRETVAAVRAQHPAPTPPRHQPAATIAERAAPPEPPRPVPRKIEFADANHRDAVMSAAVVIKTMRCWRMEERLMACDFLQNLIDEARNG